MGFFFFFFPFLNIHKAEVWQMQALESGIPRSDRRVIKEL